MPRLSMKSCPKTRGARTVFFSENMVRWVLFTAFLTACTALAPLEWPAIIVNPAESRNELQRVVQLALGERPLVLAEDALTRENVLLIETKRPRDRTGELLDGRDLGRPERFMLVMHASTCVLIHERSERRWTLKTARCAPL